MKRRTASEDEKILFRKTVETSRPQVIAKAKAKKPVAKAKLGGTERGQEKCAAVFRPAARPIQKDLDGNTKERLKRGGVRPQASMDLHGLTQEAAHRALLSFLQRSRKSGFRLTLVVTGKGNAKNEDAEWMTRSHGVLKEMVPRWLNEPEFAALIAGSTPAHVRHGGAGALYVYLRKPEF
jgi:DNA-nicking Smr family endonuclease